MKRAISWGVAGGCLVGLLVFALGVRKPETSIAVAETTSQPAESAQPAPQAVQSPAAPGQAGNETVAHTFTDDAGIQEFGRLWQRRQAALTRIAVLQAYVEQEQPALDRLNQQFLSQYHLDVRKNYSIDTERKILIELPVPPASPAGASGQTGAEAPPAQPQQP